MIKKKRKIEIVDSILLIDVLAQINAISIGLKPSTASHS